MCVIVYKPASEDRPTDEELKACWDANSHGAGIMWASQNKLYIIKGLMTFAEFLAALDGVPRTVPVVMHFRIASHGAVNAENTHPWIIDANHALVHNGIISWLGDKRDVSDSLRLASLLTKMVDKLNEPAFQAILAHALGSYNKVVLLDNTGKVHIINEDTKNWHNGCWFSNAGWQWRLRKSETEYMYGQQVIPFNYSACVVETVQEAPEEEDCPKVIEDFIIEKVAANFETQMITLTMDTGEVVECGMDEFFCNYDMFKYGDKLSGTIEDSVIQWNIKLSHMKVRK